MKLNDVITPDQLRERVFGACGPVEAEERWKRCFDQVQPYADMIAQECGKRRIPIEMGGVMTGFVVALVAHLMDEEKRTA